MLTEKAIGSFLEAKQDFSPLTLVQYSRALVYLEYGTPNTMERVQRPKLPDIERRYWNAAARLRNITIGNLTRGFAAYAGDACSFIKQERIRRQTQNPKIDGNFSCWILRTMPKEVTTEVLEFPGSALRRAAEY